jgi:GTP-binding protein
VSPSPFPVPPSPRATFVGSFPSAAFDLAPRRPEIALIGRSNVGKSSLLNALVGRRALARVSRTPGRTRGCNVFNVQDRFYYVDLPGYGYGRVSRTERGVLVRLVRDYVAARRAAVLWLLDLRREPSGDDLAMGGVLAQHSVPVLVALTKADKVPRVRRPRQVDAILGKLGTGLTLDQCVATSALTGEGVAVLKQAIERLVSGPGGKAERR